MTSCGGWTGRKGRLVVLELSDTSLGPGIRYFNRLRAFYLWKEEELEY